MSELKPCPFCGEYLINEGFGWFHAKQGCVLSSMAPFYTDNLNWNTRAPDPRIAELEAEVGRCKAIIAVFAETKAHNPPNTGKEKETI